MGRIVKRQIVTSPAKFLENRTSHPDLQQIPSADVYWGVKSNTLIIVTPDERWINYLHGEMASPFQEDEPEATSDLIVDDILEILKVGYKQ